MVMLARVMARGADLGTVEDQSFPISGFRLQNGTALPQVKIAYETYGRPRRRQAAAADPQGFAGGFIRPLAGSPVPTRQPSEPLGVFAWR
jgi:hypothetical protein